MNFQELFNLPRSVAELRRITKSFAAFSILDTKSDISEITLWRATGASYSRFPLAHHQPI